MSRRDYYYKYLESDHWKQLREQTFERDGHRCQHCGTPKNLRGHHVIYRKDLEKCTPKDIMTLCDSCHHQEHVRIKQKRKEKRARRRLHRQIRRQNRAIKRLVKIIGEYSSD